MVEPAKFYIILSTLFDQVQTNMRNFVLDTLEYEIIFDKLITNNFISITDDYKEWHAHLTQEIQVEASLLAIMKLVP